MTALARAIEELKTNPKQWEAFSHEGHCVVLAPPGSGKTKLLTAKLGQSLLGEAIRPPRGAACITMTNEAALQLRRRLRALGVGHRSNLFVGTVHAFALSRIVAPFAAAAGMAELADSRLATEAELKAAFDAAFSRTAFQQHERGEIWATTAKARQRLDLTGNRMLGGQPVAEMALLLQEELADRRLYDFHDLVRHAVDLVESNEWIRRVLAATYAHIYVDEYQDLAPGLDRIVRSVTLRNPRGAALFAVGDPDQAIYAFSGANPELLEKLSAEPAVHTVRLEHNYRCASGIIEISLKALGHPRRVVGNRDGGDVAYHPVTGGETAQTAKAIEIVQAEIESGVALEAIAIIAPWGNDRDNCADALRSVGIPVYARSETYWSTTPLTMLLETMASWAAGSADVDLGELLESIVETLPAAREHAVLSRITRVLLDYGATAPAHEFLEQVTAAALQTFVDAPSASNDARELHRMRQALAEAGPAHSLTIGDLGARARAPGHVLAATIHGAKGLEFDVVALVGADHGGLPGFNPDKEQMDEGRRKFYVSITRARERVHVVHTDSRVNRAGRPYPVRPSPFLKEIGLS